MDHPTGCPFCPGNEDATPPTIDRLDGPEGWRIRVFANLYPAVTLAGDDAGSPLRDGGRATGAHEVVVTTPRHHDGLADLDDDQVIAVMQMLAQRSIHHQDAGRTFVQAFLNHGVQAGASVPHGHAQLVALDVTPPAVLAEATRLRRGDCVACRAASGIGAEVVAAREGIVAVSPDWAVAEGELLVVPHDHEPDLTTDDGRKPAALLLRDLCWALRHAAEGDVPYNVVVHSAGRELADYHWHLHVVPRTATPGGFELGTGMFISQADPAVWARRLRDALTRG